MTLQELIYQDLLNIVDQETQIAILEDNWTSIKYIKEPSEQVQFEAVHKNVNYIEYIKKPSKKVKLFVVKQNGFLIKHIIKPSELIQLEAIKTNSLVIQYIERPSKAVQLESVQKIKADHLDFFMQYARKMINYSKALNLLYKKAPDEYKEQIKSHPNYKSDAELVLDSVKN